MKLRTLIIEDNQDDALMAVLELEKAGYKVAHLVVQTAEEMKKALKSKSWDIIICDHSMSAFNSRDALLLLQETGQDIPFIVVSGAMPEETAIDIMREGAHDVLLKKDIKRLGVIVARELVKADQRKRRREAEEKLQEQHGALEAIVESATGPVFSVDKKYRYTGFNKSHVEAMKTLYGADIELGKSLLDYQTVEADRITARVNLDKALKGERITEDVFFGEESLAQIYFEVSHNPIIGTDGKVYGVAVFALDITKRKEAEEEQVKAYKRVKATLDGIVNAVTAISSMRDSYTLGHEVSIANLVVAIAKEMGLSGDEIDELRIISMLHDIGKICGPSEILSKPGRLTDFEFDLIKTQVRVGYDIVKEAALPGNVAETILRHHERLDGSGYPEGIKEDKMNRDARILAVSDVVEAMSSHRPYRAALGIDKALEEIEDGKGKRYDPDVVDACLRLLKDKKFRFDDAQKVEKVGSET